MRNKRSAASVGGEVDLESDRAQARDMGAGRERRREAHIKPRLTPQGPGAALNKRRS